MRSILKCIVFIVEKLASELALLAAILSMTVSGSIPNRVLGGMVAIFKTIVGFTAAYIDDVHLDVVMTELAAGLDRGVAALGENLRLDPGRVLVAAIAAFIGYKLLALLLHLFRKHLLKRRHDESPPTSGHGRTYDQLYDEPMPTHSSDNAQQ